MMGAMPSTSMLYGISGTSITGRVTFGYSTLEALERLELTGAGTYEVDLAWAPSAGVKGILITFDTLDADGMAVTAPITIT